MKLASKDERWNEIMFVHLKDFKRLLKQAYTGVGLCVARRGDDVLFGGSGWAIVTEKESMDKKQLAAVIELTGELPGKGEAFKATKEENQYEIGEVRWGMPNRLRLYEINPETLCQYTGLCDKNGKKIWENDIVQYGEYTAVVRHGKYTAGFYVDFPEETNYRKDLGYWYKKVSVIGNVLEDTKGNRLESHTVSESGWIPVTERVPENDDYVLLSFENSSHSSVGRHVGDEELGGAWYVVDCFGEDTCLANDLFVNAWMPLPEPYREDE